MQDIIPPKHTQARGRIRPPVRVYKPRPAMRMMQNRETYRFSRALDGVSNIIQTASQTTITTTVVDTQQVSSVSQPLAVPPINQLPVVQPPIVPMALYNYFETTPINKAEKFSSNKTKTKRKHDIKRSALTVVATLLIIVTGYVSIDTWVTNSRVSGQIKQTEQTDQTDTVVAGGSGATWTSEQEGQDETNISSDALSKYAVAADLPRALYIDKLNISARILPMSVNTTGNIQAPLNIYDAGWYNGSVKPGQIGAMFIDGHASGMTRQGLFAYLDTLNPGDTLQVEKGDGTFITYEVIHREVVPLKDIDMKKVLLPYGNTLRGLNLMTCIGTWLPNEKTYDHRVVVYTKQV